MDIKTMYCNNCGERGHAFKTCKDPITSCGVFLLREIYEPMKLPNNPSNVSVIMVKRKDSMAYMEFIRGKYDLINLNFVKKLISNMTIDEQKKITTESFDTLWANMWGQGRDTHSTEYEISKKQYDTLDRASIVKEVPSAYKEPEWGFPKGRRMKGETDEACALREFWEETNIPADAYDVVPNVSYTEILTGTNDFKNKHEYLVALLKNSKLINSSEKLTPMQKKEVSAVSWKTLKDARSITRPHYVERKKILETLEREIRTYQTV
jgi:8-oxo-dGTP pyrophosphatase MutT (NUDIX family)